MNRFAQVGIIGISDYRERVRRFSFLVAIVFTLAAGYFFMPPSGADYTSFIINDHRGFYSSAWVGTLFGVTSATLLSLIGFYLVRTSVTRDYDTRVGQIIAASSVTNITYLLGKWLSNVLLLASLLAVLSLVAPVMQLIRAEDTHIALPDLWLPIWILGLPSLAFIAALAIFFETVRSLRGVWGNVIFYFFWSFALVGVSAMQFDSGIKPIYLFDFTGMLRISTEVSRQLVALGVDVTKGTCALLGSPRDPAVLFQWQAIQWTFTILFERFFWAGVALVVALVASLPFDRFKSTKSTEGTSHRWFRKKAQTIAEHAEQHPPVATSISLTPVAEPMRRFSFGQLLFAELWLMLKGYSIWWYLAILGLNIAVPLVPSEYAANLLFAIATLLPLGIWSSMGNRELLNQTYLTIFTTSHFSRRQLPALWISGLIVMLLASSGYLLRILVYGETTLFLPFLIGLAFVPSLALALGVWTNGKRTFEVFYLILWYTSIQDGAAPLDFRGGTQAAADSGVYIYYLGITLLLITLALLGRKKQLTLVS